MEHKAGVNYVQFGSIIFRLTAYGLLCENDEGRFCFPDEESKEESRRRALTGRMNYAKGSGGGYLL